MTEPTISILIEIPESLHEALRQHLAGSDQTQDDAYIAAISMYLLQNCKTSIGANYSAASRHYLNTLFSDRN